MYIGIYFILSLFHKISIHLFILIFKSFSLLYSDGLNSIVFTISLLFSSKTSRAIKASFKGNILSKVIASIINSLQSFFGSFSI